jgi:hypothetical protein
MDGFSSEQVVLTGLGGFLEGEEFILRPGITYSVGRSSSADISLKKGKRFSSLEEEGILLDQAFRRTSRVHLTIKITDECEYAETTSQLKVRVRGAMKVEIHSLSPNGIRFDGQEATDVVVPDMTVGKQHTIEFGAGEILKLSMRVLP